jgi:hypothetical protein
VTTPKEKGDALEAAVAAIEEFILQSSAALNKKPTIEKKKIIVVNGVRHEIDVYVTADLGPGYKPVFIFECKNWQEAVNKNEVIIFSEKIDVSQATSGCFVAKSYTADAEAQAKKDPRITLLLAAEHDPANPAIDFFSRFPEMTKLDMRLSARGSKGLTMNTVRFDDARIIYRGVLVDFREQVNAWSIEACDKNLMEFFNELVPEGLYQRSVDHERIFPPGELTVNDLDIEKMFLHVDYQVRVLKSPVVSHFEVQSRGRFISFAPLVVGNTTMQWNVVMTSPK